MIIFWNVYASLNQAYCFRVHIYTTSNVCMSWYPQQLCGVHVYVHIVQVFCMLNITCRFWQNVSTFIDKHDCLKVQPLKRLHLYAIFIHTAELPESNGSLPRNSSFWQSVSTEHNNLQVRTKYNAAHNEIHRIVLLLKPILHVFLIHLVHLHLVTAAMYCTCNLRLGDCLLYTWMLSKK